MRKERIPGRDGRRKLPGAALCALLALGAALVSFLPYLIRDRGFFTLAYDYNLQQIPFAAAAYEGVKQIFSGEWIWNLDQGSSLITGFGFYNLGSPFFWATLVFPKESFPLLAGELYMLKYMTAAVLAYSWLKQFVREETSAVLGGLLYAFSGFQSTNLLYFHFHDIVAFFPLLLWGMDRLVREKKSLLFSAAVFLNSLVNYTFFVQEAIFLAVYFLFRYFERKRAAESLRLGLRIFLRAALGLAMAAFLFLPNAMYVLGSARGKSRFDLSRLLYDIRGTLFILKGFLFPGEAMSEQSAVYQYQYGSTSLYIPFFGMTGAAIYLAGNRGWLRNLLLVLIPISFSPLIQSGFLLFTEPNQRWWYMLNLLCVLATVLALERGQHRTKKARGLAWLCCGGTAVFCLALGLLRGPSGGTLVQSRALFLLFGGMAVLFSAACGWMIQRDLLSPRSALAAALAACVLTTAAAVGAYKRGDDHDGTVRDYQVGLNLKGFDDQYRYNTSHNLFTMPAEGAGVGAFSSTAENSSYAFRSKVYDFNANFTYQSVALPGLPELLGGRYEILVDPKGRPLLDDFEAGGFRYGIAEKEACPIGFATGNYITLEELHKYPRDARSYVLMDAVAVETAEKVEAYYGLRFEEAGEPENPAEAIRRTVENRVRQFSRDGRGFSCTTDFPRNQLVFFSVPNDPGWTACIDQEKTEIIDACGMMALSVPAGNHAIEFSYRTPGLRMGTAVSLAGWLVFCLLLILRRRAAARRRGETAGAGEQGAVQH